MAIIRIAARSIAVFSRRCFQPKIHTLARPSPQLLILLRVCVHVCFGGHRSHTLPSERHMIISGHLWLCTYRNTPAHKQKHRSMKHLSPAEPESALQWQFYAFARFSSDPASVLPLNIYRLPHASDGGAEVQRWKIYIF